MTDAALGTLRASLGSLEDAVTKVLRDWDQSESTARLWKQDASVWTNSGEENWLGWLDVVSQQVAQAAELSHIAQEAKQAGFETVLLLGMGGSSLGPEVIGRTLGKKLHGMDLVVLDSTVPQHVDRLSQLVDLAKTLFVVASKSGGTTEPNAFKQFFYEKVVSVAGADAAGQQFVAITDPGSSLEALAKAEHFRAIVHGTPSIGGRYSVLSPFGMLPAAFLGTDTASFLKKTAALVNACKPDHTGKDNPGVYLGVLLGVLAQKGRDKVTFTTTPGVASLGAWLEQLIAESSGKLGKGIIPVDGEELAAPEAYDADRLFVRIALADEINAAQERQCDALESAGHPVVRIDLPDAESLGQEFYRWEFATAVACAVMGINAFDQPDVEASKVATRKLTSAFEESGALPEDTPLLSDNNLSLHAEASNADRVQGCTTMAEALAAHLATLKTGDYFAINAYVDMNAAHQAILQTIRSHVRDTHHVATTVGFGPRFLHSTGQLHKGGPNNGVFLQLTAGEPTRLPVPKQRYSFGELARFQAQGDLEVLIERQRRVLRIDLGNDSLAGLKQLQDLLLNIS